MSAYGWMNTEYVNTCLCEGWIKCIAELHSALRKREIVSFVTNPLKVENIMLNEVDQTKKANIIWFHLYMKSKKQNKWTNVTKQKQS